MEVAWQPSAEYLERSLLRSFLTRHGLHSYGELVSRAAEDIEWFTEKAVEALEIEWRTTPARVVDLSRGPAWPEWFPGGVINLTEQALDRHVRNHRDRLALVWEGEEGATRTFSYGELLAEVNRCAAGLQALGVRRGDRVGLYLPMIPEVAIALLAVARIGAIYTPIFSGFAAQAVASRLESCQAKVLVTADGYYRRGRLVNMKETADKAAEAVPSVEHVVVVHRTGQPVSWQAGSDVWWHELVAGQPTAVPAVPMAASDPFMIIYTSGTTGRPKGAVHSHTGFPLKAAIDMYFLFDIHPDDVVTWVTDMGWMMGPWVVLGGLIRGATVFMYDGTIDYPGPDRLWQLVERHRITSLGISPTVIRSLMPHGPAPVRQHDLGSLRTIGSTGEPWNPEAWWWTFEHVGGRRCPIINYSGGTEISGGILGCTTITPQKPCSFSGPAPGMAADVVDENAQPIRGEVGELVIRKPWLGMTMGFWQDPKRYEDTYWSRWPGVWVHGDWALVDEDGFWFLEGRSDDTMKVAGKRLGPAEVESAAAAHPDVVEAAAIGVPDPVKGEEPVVFVVLRPGSRRDGIENEIADTVAVGLGKAFRPAAVHVVSQLAHTRNGKILRRLMRAAYLGQAGGDISSLENPQALDEVRALGEAHHRPEA